VALELKRALRGAGERALAQVVGLLPGPARVEDVHGRVVAGDPSATGDRFEVVAEDIVVGAVVGPAGSERVAALVAHLFEKELEKRALADETLGRYKELTLLYETIDKLSTLLDLEAVAGLVVGEAQRHLRASGGSVLLHDARRHELEVVAAVGEEREQPVRIAAESGVEGRVLRTGRAEFVEDVADTDTHVPRVGSIRSMICAPLRVGERVFGVLRVSLSGATTVWTAGDLKLVTALATQAASAISNAQLHRERLRELALRHQVERLVSSRLLDVVFDRGVPRDGADLAIAFCDLRQLSSLEPHADPERLLLRVEAGVVDAVDAFLGEGATVDTPQGELVVGVFWDHQGLPAAASRAIRASRLLVERLHRDGRGGPGIGIAAATIAPGEGTGLRAGLNAAAMLQYESEGRVLVDYPVAEAVPGFQFRPAGQRELPGGPAPIFEVPA
jgi:adenylate cyclase